MLIDVAVIVPVMRRPQNVKPFVESCTSTAHTANIYFIVDHDDMAEMAAVEVVSETYDRVNMIINESESKTFATKCNLGYRETTEPWLFFVGDDVRFWPGWWAEIVDSDDGSAFVATNDMRNRTVMAGQHATHPAIRRDWLDDHGASWDGEFTVCHEGYRHWYVDNEWTAVSMQNGQFRYCSRSLVEHQHPIWNDAPNDEVYKLGQSFAEQDRVLWLERSMRFADAS